MEDGVLGNLAPPGDLEESASHHVQNHVPATYDGDPPDFARRAGKMLGPRKSASHKSVSYSGVPGLRSAVPIAECTDRNQTLRKY